MSFEVTHPEPLPVLWGYGFMRILSRLDPLFDFDFTARFWGDICKIEIDISQYQSEWLKSLDEEIQREIQELKEFLEVTEGLGNFLSEASKLYAKWKKGVTEFLTKQANLKNLSFSKYYFSQNSRHRCIKEETVRKKETIREEETVYLFLMPFGGDKKIFFLRGEESKNYKVCKMCYALILIGFFNFLRYISVKDKKRKRLTLFLPYVEGELSGNDIYYLLSFGRKLNFADEGLKISSHRAHTIYTLSQGETTFALSTIGTRASIKLVIWTFEKSGKAPAIRKFEVIELERLLEVISQLKVEAPDEWNSLVDTLARFDEGDELLSTLYEAILYSKADLIYNFVRRLKAIMISDKIKRKISIENIVRTLLEFVMS